MLVTRRNALLGLAAAFSLGPSSLALAGAATDRRFVVIIQRGAMDGLAAVTPYGDPALAGLRAELLPEAAVGQPGGLLDLGGFYGLHPALVGMHQLYLAGELLPIHAVAGHYRTRSHFEAQDYLESGADQRMQSGWLNRAVSLLPARPAGSAPGLSVGVSLPLLLRGPGGVGAYAPEARDEPSPELYARLLTLNAADPVIGPSLHQGLRDRETDLARLPAGSADAKTANAFPALAGAAGKLLAAVDGPRIAALEIGGWDTHAGQKRRLDGPLAQLDAGILALKAGLGPAWRQTVVLTVTEFGRTVRMNGTGGTDHGTGTVAFLAGGAVAGGRVGGDWPGLAALFENRDLQPTTDLRSVALGILSQHLRLGPKLDRVFPGYAQSMNGLIRA